MLKIEFLAQGHAALSKSWKGQDIDETFTRLYYIIAGGAEIGHHGRTFFMKPGHFYLIPPRSAMRYRCRKNFEVAWIHFNISVYGHMDLFSCRKCDFVYGSEETDNKSVRMLELLALIEREDIFSQLRAKSLLLELLAPFFRFSAVDREMTGQGRGRRLIPVLDYIDRNLHRKITLAELAKIAAYEETYFSFLFKQAFAESPIKYIQKRRIEAAQSMLRNPEMKLSAIAEKTCFNDAYHLSKTFKKITGECPREFRKRIPQVRP